MRVVLDTNVLISAFFWEGNPRKIYRIGKGKGISILMSNPMEKELIRVLKYKKFGLTDEEIAPLLIDIRLHCEFVEVRTVLNLVNEDPTDNIFIECSIDGKASFIITGDCHLLKLKSYKEIQIVTPVDFVKIFRRSKNVEKQ